MRQQNHFIKLYDNLCLDCSLNERVIFSYIVDRMNSSRQRYQFFDSSQNDFYVIFTIQELSTVIGVSHDTISRALNHLTNKGYLIIQHNKYHANKIFIMPEYHYLLSESIFDKQKSNDEIINIDTAKSDTSTAKSDTNQTNINQTNINTSDTYVTDIHNDDQQLLKKVAMDNLETSIVERVGLPEKAVHIMNILSFGNPKLFHHYVSLVLRAKKHVMKHAPATTYSLIFDKNNQNLACSFNKHIYSILINANKKAKNRDKYIMRSLINFFKEHYNQYEIVS